MSSCVIHPTVKNPNTGTITHSVLYGDLLKYSNNNRGIANDVYTKSLGEEFREFVMSENDSNGEPLLEDILYRFNDEEIIPDSTMENTLSKDVGEASNKGIRATKIEHQYSYNKNRELASKAIKFNDGHKYSKAYLSSIESDGNTSSIKFERVSQTELSNTDISRNERMFKALENILKNAGIGIRVLEELEKKNINGYVDFSTAEKTAEDLKAIITLIKGDNGIQALPEEFSHVMLEMLGKDNPLVKRLYSALNSDVVEAILGEEYDTYYTLHNGSEANLMKEAAAKILAEAIKGEFYEEIAPLQQRLLNTLKGVVSRLSDTTISDALYEIANVVDELKKDIFKDTIYHKLSILNVEVDGLLYQADTLLDQQKELFDAFFEIGAKKEFIEESKGIDISNRDFQHTGMLTFLSNGNFYGGALYFLKSISNEAQRLNSYINADTFNKRTPKSKFNTIHTAFKLQYTLQASIEAYNSFIGEHPNVETEELKSAKNALREALSKLEDSTLTIAKTLTIEEIMRHGEYLGDLTKIKTGRGDDTFYTLRDIIEKNPFDITFFEKWTNAAAQTSDPIIRIFDRIIKVKKEQVRQEFIKDLDTIKSLGLKAEREGITDWSFMYRKDSLGNAVPELIPIRDFKRYRSYIQGLPNSERKNAEYESTEEIFDGLVVPKANLFPSKEFEALSDKQKRFYMEYLSLKNKYDQLLPFVRGTNRLGSPIFLRKNKYDRLKDKGLTDLYKGIKDDFVKTIEDIDIIDMDEVMLDFSGVPVLSVPLNYISMGSTDTLNDYNINDAIGGLSVFAYMAINHAKMYDMVDFIEVSKEVVANRKIGEGSIEKFMNKGITVINNAYMRKGTSNFLSRFYSLIDANVYGVGTRKLKVVGKDITKLGGNLAAINGITTMSLNGLNIVANVLNGLLQSTIEAAANDYFKAKDLLNADIIYSKNAPEIIIDSYSRIKNNKVSLANKLFNTIQGHRLDQEHREFNKDRWIKKFLSPETLSDGNSAGEHFLHSRTMIAVLLSTKVTDKNGKVSNMWNILETANVDNDSKNGKYIYIPKGKGYKLEDGTELNTDSDIEKYITKTSLKINSLNQRMYGIYNKLDSSMAQQYNLGILMLMYRKWLKPSLDRRFKRGYYNYDLEADVEGYYATLMKHLKNTIIDIYRKEFDFKKTIAGMRKDKTNMIRALTEMLLTFSLFALSKFYYDEDDRPYSKRSYYEKFLEFLVRRMYTESVLLTPSTGTLNSFAKLFSNPLPALDTFGKGVGLLTLIFPDNYGVFYGEDAEIKSGRFKGWTKAEKILFNSPFTLFVPNLYKAYHIEDQINFYKRENQ